MTRSQPIVGESELLDRVAHRPRPLPSGPWIIHMGWRDLAFIHWPVDPDEVARHIPAPLELELFDHHAWLGIVPFRMDDVHARLSPPIPGTDAFPELNVRTYVRYQERRGVWFFSLDATSRLAVRGARLLYNLPYFDAEMSLATDGVTVRYDSRRVHRGAPPAEFRATYRPVGGVYYAAPGTLDYFLTERYCLFTQSRTGGVAYLDVHHVPWPLQPAAADVVVNTMASAAGISLPDRAPLVHFAASLDVLAWHWRRIT